MAGKLIDKLNNIKKTHDKKNASYYTVTTTCNISAGHGVVGAYGTSQWDSPWSGTYSVSSRYYETTDDLAIEVHDVSGYEIVGIEGQYNVKNIRGPYSMSGGKYWRFQLTTDAQIKVTYRQTTRRYTVSLLNDPSGGGSCSGAGTYNEGATVTIKATANSGYRFKCWREGGTQQSWPNPYSFYAYENRTIYAVYERIVYNISVLNDPSGGGTTRGSGTYGEGATVTIEATPNRGYRFKCWREGGTQQSWPNPYSFYAYENRTIYAVYESIPSYNVSIVCDPEEGGTSSGQGTYYEGETVTVVAIPRTPLGYEFAYWKEGGGRQEFPNPYTFLAYENRYLTAVFNKLIKVTTSISPIGWGTATGAGFYKKGDKATITAYAFEGYRFDYWRIGIQVYRTAELTIDIEDNDIEAIAFFVYEKTYIITTSALPSRAGVVEGGGTYHEPTEITIKATPNVGYEFLYWYHMGEHIEEAEYTFIVSKSDNYIAIFKAIKHFPFTIKCFKTNGSIWELGEGIIGENEKHTNDQSWYGSKTITEANYDDTTITYRITVSNTRGATVDSVEIGKDIINLEGPFTDVAGTYWTFKVNGSEPTLNVIYEEETKYQLTLNVNPFSGYLRARPKHRLVGSSDFNTTSPYNYYYNDYIELLAVFHYRDGDIGYEMIFTEWTAPASINGELSVKVYMPNHNWTVTANYRVAREIPYTINVIELEGLPVDVTFETKIYYEDDPTRLLNHITEGAIVEITPHINTNNRYFAYWKIKTENNEETSYQLNYKGTIKVRAEDITEMYQQYTMYVTNAQSTYRVIIKSEPLTVNGRSLQVRFTYPSGETKVEYLVDTEKHYDIIQGTKIVILATSMNTQISFVEWITDIPSIRDNKSAIFENEYLAKEGVIIAKFDYNNVIKIYTNPSNSGRIIASPPISYLEGNKYSIPTGSKLSINVEEYTGYSFLYWLLDNKYKSTNRPYIIDYYDNTKYSDFQAVMMGATPDKYIVVVIIKPLNSGSVSGSGIYDSGATCTLVAEANEGYVFDHWGDDLDNTDSTYEFTVTSNVNIIAYFRKQDKPPIPPLQPFNLLGWWGSRKKRKRVKIIIK